VFDSPNRLRRTSQSADFLDPEPPEEVLLDHILFTQALVGGGQPEHEIYERVDSLLPGRHTLSDHRPVSVSIVER